MVAVVPLAAVVVIGVIALLNSNWQEAMISTAGSPDAVDGAVPLARDWDAFDDHRGFDDSADAEASPETSVVDPLAPLVPAAPTVQVALPDPVVDAVEPVAPTESVPPRDPVVDPAEPVNLVTGGGFDDAGYSENGGRFAAGTTFGGWELLTQTPAGAPLVIWSEELGEPVTDYAAPFTQGPWARIMGTIQQTLPTDPGQTYLLEYQTRASGAGANSNAVGWGGGNTGIARIDGVEVDRFTTVVDPLYTHRSVIFTASATSTTLAFSNAANGTNGGAIGIDSISVTEMP